MDVVANPAVFVSLRNRSLMRHIVYSPSPVYSSLLGSSKKDWRRQADWKSCGQRCDKGGYGYRVGNKSHELVDLLSSKGLTPAVIS